MGMVMERKKQIMKLVEINSGNFGSTGTIMNNIAHSAYEEGYDVYTFYGKSRTAIEKNPERGNFIGTILGRNFHIQISQFVPLNGCLSIVDTFFFVHKLKKIKPDLIHVHNLHNGYINIPIFMNYVKKNNIKIVWTLHDCWSFTGHCAYYDMSQCKKWKNGCNKCPALSTYPKTYVDDSKNNYRRKKKWFTSVELTLVTPSKWLLNEVKKSFLKYQKCLVINNGIDLEIFKPYESKFREIKQCEGKFIILGVALTWGERKGLDYFIRLASEFGEKYKVVLVGTTEEDIKRLPTNILAISRTENAVELAKIYSAADVFVNPTMEENFPTVNIEALACGTPVITFNTGGSSEMISNKTGISVERGNYLELIKAINYLYENRNQFTSAACVERATKYTKKNMCEEYIRLFNQMLNK